MLARHVPAQIVAPLTLDIDRGLLLLPDGGAALDPEADLQPALAAYAGLQRGLAPHTDELLAAGVPDMRPDALPERFDEAVDYAGARLDARVPARRARFVEWCDELAAAPGGASLDHNDLHPHNILAGPVFYDWGDACVAHPFACLLVPLRKGGPGAAALRATYLTQFADLGSPAELERIARLAVRVAPVARALTWKRALAGHAAAEDRYVHFAAAELAALLAD